MSKLQRVRAVTDKALGHLADDERALVREVMKDVGRVFELTRAIAQTPLTTDEGIARIGQLQAEIEAITEAWTHD